MKPNKLVFMLIFVLLVAAGAVAYSSTLLAGGDKNREASPILPPGDVDCIYIVPPGIDLDTCTLLVSSDQSQQAFICSALVPSEGDIIVICNE